LRFNGGDGRLQGRDIAYVARLEHYSLPPKRGSKCLAAGLVHIQEGDARALLVKRFDERGADA
jgi:hypothetical protein